jgi:hypothetical protein
MKEEEEDIEKKEEEKGTGGGESYIQASIYEVSLEKSDWCCLDIYPSGPITVNQK